MKEKLERRRVRVQLLRHWLIVLFIVEALIALILHPQWTGVPVVERFLASISEFFHNLLWPHGNDDQSYRMIIYQAVVWIETLPFYSLLRTVVVYGIPLGLLATIVWSIIIKQELKKPDKPKSRQDFQPGSAAHVISRSGPSPLWQNETMRRLQKVQARCDDDFFAGYGPFVHVHRVSESDELTPDLILDLSGGEARFSYGLGDTTLTVEFFCQDGQPMLRGDGSPYPLEAGRTFQILSDSRGSQGIVQYQITWLDQKEVGTC